ncbi:MAG: hypothetical protein K9J16_04940 [Melioribacteraceae bacterium]|nr:hypothetical protein [Melioribacteraceae bacterium]MCF8354190.1 hypothetical protein [Melioribacteraceae bacterium]MCF8392836.1 hypothetical protein [Melioribacteraceae bacterium]MCF8418678.1 hypothetical protein [Melioribacteraceae bacterium]
MRKLSMLFLFIPVLIFGSGKLFFAEDPALSPDGSTIIFSYENDLWKVNSIGGTALRITGMEGRESNPAFSPDGKWIAFTGRQTGSAVVYIMPVAGGEIKQLTYHSSGSIVEGWSWDSKFIYFTSSRYNSLTSYKISIDGGTPVRLFDHYFNWVHNLAELPGGNEYLFNESWESYRFPQRKRYKGDFNPDIKYYNTQTDEYKQLTTYRGKDMWATVDKTGKIYFVSDEANDEYNLYTFENENKVQLTNFNSSIKRPRVSADGNKIVFTKDYQIYCYDVTEKETNLVGIKTYQNETLQLEREFDIAGKITNYNISPDNKKIAFVSRGELFVSDIEGKFIRQIETNPNEKIDELIWLKDNKTILFTQTVKGWTNLFKINADGTDTEEQITFDDQSNRELQYNSDRTKALYFSGRHELRIIDLENMDSETIVEDEFWALGATAAYFSPDDRYVLYTANRDFEEDIFVYDTESKESKHITKTGVTETDPFWSADGKYIYLATNRYKPSYPFGLDDTEIIRIKLQNTDDEFKRDKFDDLFIEKEKDSSEVQVEISFDGMNDRWESIVDFPGRQNSPYVITKDDETTILYSSNHDNDGWALWKTVLKPFESPKTEKISGVKSGSTFIWGADDKYYLLANGDIYTLNLSSNKAEKIDMKYKFNKNIKDEFTQMFYESWARMDENYYDGDFHGTDWNKVRDYYEKFLPELNSRDNYRSLLNDMLGELNSSHQGFYSSGDEEDVFYKNSTYETGIIYSEENPYSVERIVKRSSVDKEDKEINRGDLLVAVDGVKVDESVNRNYYFTTTSIPDEVELTFKRGGEEFTTLVHPQSAGSLSGKLYDEWVDWNQNFVDEKSEKRIAYIQMKNMGGGSLNDFYVEIANEAMYRDALILDLRYNTGGNVHDKVLQLLSQKPYLNWKYRDGQLANQPNFSPAGKPIVLLINEQSLSDAEMTAAGFKELGLGTIIGTETYRWIIFTSGTGLVDGSFMRLPSWGCYTLDGKDLEMNGVEPDIYVKTTFHDRLNENDPQLKKAVDYILEKL